MKITIEIDCSPQEAREFLGFPDIKPLQDVILADATERVKSSVAAMDAEGFLKLWLPMGLQGIEQLNRLFQSQFRAASGKDTQA